MVYAQSETTKTKRKEEKKANQKTLTEGHRLISLQT